MYTWFFKMFILFKTILLNPYKVKRFKVYWETGPHQVGFKSKIVRDNPKTKDVKIRSGQLNVLHLLYLE